MPSGRVAASMPENLSLFLDPPAKSEESGGGSSKKLSKDSILSLYGTSSLSQTSMAAHGESLSMSENLGGALLATVLSSNALVSMLLRTAISILDSRKKVARFVMLDDV